MAFLDRFSLQGKRALVTGAGRGLGAGVASALAGAGATVALVSRSEHQLAETAKAIGPSAVTVVADVTDPDTFASLVDRVEEALGGPIDVVVHGAGVQHRQPATEFEREAWDRVLAVNVSAPFFLSQVIGSRQLAAKRPGNHIFIGSLASHLALPNVVAYTVSKSGIYGLVRNLSLEWSGLGIRVNGIGPGYVPTSLTEALMNDPAQRARLLSRIPMGRFGTPEEIGNLAVFLASDASSYITGQLVMVDGGWLSS
jgi:NAD(P)-dependent dehydrogenase (short-subunit alcohol dehydrogenase family)